MAKVHGKNGRVELGANAIAELTSWSYEETVEAADTTAMEDTAMTHLTGIPGWTASISGWYDPADTNGQMAILIGASLSPEFYPEGNSSSKAYATGTASVVRVGRQVEVNGIVQFSCDLQGNGALTHGTVA